MNVVVAGGGPAGCATAIAAAAGGHRVMLCDAATPSRRASVFETLPPACQPALHALGAWPAFCALQPDPCRGIASAWAGDDLVWSDALRNPLGAGWIVDRVRFDRMLRAVAARAGVDVREGTRVTQVTPNADRWCVSASAAGRSWKTDADIVIDATGRTAAVARRRDTTMVIHDRLVAVGQVGSSRVGAPAHSVVEAVEDGWWFATALGRRAVAVYFTDRDLMPRDRLTASGWRAALRGTKHVRRLLGDAAGYERPYVRAARSQHLSSASGPGWLAVGDAAAAWDPLSSAGVVTALRRGTAAAASLTRNRAFEYAASITAANDGYLAARMSTYQAEWRWPRSPFWERRQQPAPPHNRPTIVTSSAARSVRPNHLRSTVTTTSVCSGLSASEST